MPDGSGYLADQTFMPGVTIEIDQLVVPRMAWKVCAI